MHRASLVVSLLAVTAPAIAGCGSTARLTRENERLRQELRDLGHEVERLEDLNSQLLAELERARMRPETIPEEILESTPRLARISIGGLSHAEDADGDGTPETLVVHVKPTDERGRFVQLVGRLSAHAAILPAGSEAVTIGRIELGPAEVRDAYRSSFLGSHYTVAIPLTLTQPADDCMVRVEFVDGRSGLHHTVNEAIDL